MPEGTVTVWLVRPGPVAADVLGRSERARADEMRRPADRQRYVAAHVALRVLVGARLGVPAADVTFGREPCPLCGGPHGRPTVACGGVWSRARR